MSEVRRVFSGSPWEPVVGYCRALRVGSQIFVSGTAPVDDNGEVVAPGDGYAQAKCCFDRVGQALQALGVDCRHVVRTRMFVTEIDRWEEFAKAHQEYFGETPPVATMVEVKSLIDPQMLIEVEVEAFDSD
ncbi:hypothetical protein AY599_20300 [Leptolyngbya valderiana BDU 20041]|nr:RidA family protein [Geitlerinema sp. CS-897]OAB63815.1 hypothetical protein AY599_20300 [Leptolyngbya valderiana BDU 20041]PPT11359.1 Putative translation initiation inhibitor yjgF family [Geitlerinema sp. FC II]